ncbi:hypothetical protein [Mycobacterium yunnanensis]
MSTEMKESTSMTILDRFTRGVVGAVAGLCGVAVAVSPGATAAPLKTGGYECLAPALGGSAPAPAAAPAAGGAAACAPVGGMGGIPMGLPGPPPVAPPPVVPPVAPPPIVPPIAPPPIVPPIAPPIVPAAPLAPAVGGMGGVGPAGGYGGKGDLILPADPGAPASGQPILPGPAARGAS